MKHTVFLVEDSDVTRHMYATALTAAGFTVRTFENAETFLAVLETVEPSVVCLDVILPGMSGMEALERVRARRPQVPVMMITSRNEAPSGVTAMKRGAVDYLVKPVDLDLLEQTVRSAAERFELVLEIRRLTARSAEPRVLSEILGRSPAMDRVVAQIGLVLGNDTSVFLHGETGTGKDLIARTIHGHSHRAGERFVAVNCGAIPRDLQESQFFGHERGAFTGAVQRHIGFFEEANHGTIFLDEVAELTPSAQIQLLRTLQEREIRRVGGEEIVPIDVRVISASTRDLSALAARGEFREDLLYRLVVFSIRVPPLRERREDIPLLAGHFLRQTAENLGVGAVEVTDEALRCLVEHSWPGNIRELQNAIQVAVLSSRGMPIHPEHFPAFLHRGRAPRPEPIGEVIDLVDPLTGRFRSLSEIELEVLVRARELTGGNIRRTAQILGIGRATAYRKLQAAGRTGEHAAPRPESIRDRFGPSVPE